VHAWPPGRWTGPAGPFASRAAAAHHLAEQLATAAWQLEPAADRALPAPPPLPLLPDEPAVVDQLAVTADDLGRALDGAGSGRSDAAVAVGALAEVVLHRYDLDGSLPGRRAARALRLLDEGMAVAEPDRLLELARARCSG